MVTASDLFTGGDVPTGDALRGTGAGSVSLLDATLTTVLNLSTTKGIYWGTFVTCPSSSGYMGFYVVKVTVDGAAERTIISGSSGDSIALAANTTSTVNYHPPIKFQSSLVVKITATVGGGGTMGAFPHYSIRP